MIFHFIPNFTINHRGDACTNGTYYTITWLFFGISLMRYPVKEGKEVKFSLLPDLSIGWIKDLILCIEIEWLFWDKRWSFHSKPILELEDDFGEEEEI